MTFVDALMTKLPSFNSKELGNWFVRMQNGVVHVYGAVMAVGLVTLMSLLPTDGNWNQAPVVADVENHQLGGDMILARGGKGGGGGSGGGGCGASPRGAPRSRPAPPPRRRPFDA